MTTCTSAFGRANASGLLKASTALLKPYSTTSATPNPSTLSKATDAAHQRELFVNVLNANATRRDAKQYLSRFRQGSIESLSSANADTASHRAVPRRGALHGPTRAIAENPQFVRDAIESDPILITKDVLHVALVMLRSPQTVDDSILGGLALTLSQLVQLDMRIVLVLDCGDASHAEHTATPNAAALAKVFHAQADRLTLALDKHSIQGARVVDGAFDFHTSDSPADFVTSNVIVGVPSILLGPLKRGSIPILPTLAYTSSGQTVPCSPANVMSALALFFSGLSRAPSTSVEALSTATSVDRIIVLDELGGIPSKTRNDEAHVFINLKQEFDDIKNELSEYSCVAKQADSRATSIYEQHLTNLQMLRDCLALLPSASSALIITPEEVANSSRNATSDEHTIGIGTRRQKNSLIHNLLTNKPMVSPSLPVARLPSTPSPDGNAISTHEALRSTLVKTGLSLTIIPHASPAEGWQPPASGSSTLDLEHDPRVDLARLTYLIEDSFRRKLDLKHYLARIRGRTAGLIVAGSYDGAAILTWEQPLESDDPSRLVPYLDKFAVLSNSQGAAGVADILFQAMVRTCFPHGVCWRSRKDNPVNKWYFERADGHWQIPETNWTMFWTGAGVVEDKQRFEDYVAVCSNIEASWKDGKRPD